MPWRRRRGERASGIEDGGKTEDGRRGLGQWRMAAVSAFPNFVISRPVMVYYVRRGSALTSEPISNRLFVERSSARSGLVGRRLGRDPQ